eukprot:scaffold308_cov224-Prasinococcus_capsulatus_cf.AAC.1
MQCNRIEELPRDSIRSHQWLGLRVACGCRPSRHHQPPVSVPTWYACSPYQRPTNLARQSQIAWHLAGFPSRPSPHACLHLLWSPVLLLGQSPSCQDRGQSG